MSIILTNHARMRAAERGITIEQIIECVTNPDTISTELDGKICYKKLIDPHLLLCYTTDEQGNIVVITVIKTSKIDKYY